MSEFSGSQRKLDYEDSSRVHDGCLENGGISEKFIQNRSRGVCLPAAIADGLARHHAQEQLLYKQKLRKLKTMVKNIVLENAALCDTVASVQEDIALAMEERRCLVRKLMQLQVNAEQQQLHYTPKGYSTDIDEQDKQTIRKVWSDDTTSNVWSALGNKVLVTKQKQMENLSALPQHPASQGAVSKARQRSKKLSKGKNPCPPLPLDSSGRPVFPVSLGKLTIHSLGEIVCEKEGYHSPLSIYPVGFCSSRVYANPHDPHQPALYTCTIKDGGVKPSFQICCDEEDFIFEGSSPAECHCQLMKKINEVIGMDLLQESVESPGSMERSLRFFGLSHPSVQNILQACPGSRKCSKYKWIHFQVCKSEAEADSVSIGDREASICHETLLRNIRFASNM